MVGISNVVQCHGSFATATCTKPACRAKVSADQIKKDIFEQRIPYCQVCSKDYKEPQAKSCKSKINGVAESEPQKDLNQINHVDVDHNGEHKPISEKNDVASSSQDSVSTNHESPVLPESSVSSSNTPTIEANMNVQPISNEGACAPGMTAPVELPGIMKPDIVFFGEGLGDEFHKSVAIDKDEVSNRVIDNYL